MVKISNDLMLGVSTDLFDVDSLMEAVGIMKELGASIVKVPILWSSVMPEKGKINSIEIEKYKKFFSEIIKHSIKSIAVLNNHSVPDWFELLGGWSKRENLCYYDEYCMNMFKGLGNAVSYWVTQNNPIKEAVNLSKWAKEVPDSSEIYEALNIAHNLNLSHGRAVNIFRQENLRDSDIGLCLNIIPIKAKSMNIADILTANYIDSIINKLHLDAVLNGRYPKDTLKFFEKYIGAPSFIKEGDMKCISAPIDFIGMNYYGRNIVKYSQSAPLKFEFVIGKEEETDTGIEITPEFLYRALKKVKDEYSIKVPIFISECGGEFIDEMTSEGVIKDYKRMKYLQEHLAQAQRFIDEGGFLKGFCAASLMDSKTHENSLPCFGISYYNNGAEKYILKYSGKWYMTVIASKTI